MTIAPSITLYPFQEEGVNFLATHANNGCLLADEMGLGKTIQVLYYLDWLLATGNIKNNSDILVVCPKSLTLNWLIEAGRFSPVLQRSLTIESYSMIHTLSSRGHWDAIILDEAQYIKTPTSRRSIAVGRLRGDRRIAITGSPILNTTVEVWNILNWLQPNQWGGYRWFGKRFSREQKPRRGQSGIRYLPGTLRSRELSILLSKVMLRRKKREVLKELPHKVRQIITITRGEQAAESWPEISTWLSEEDQGFSLPLKEIARFRHYQAVVKASCIVRDHRDFLNNLPKPVIFAYHKETLRILRTSLKSDNMFYVDGSSSTLERQRCTDGFNAADEAIFIGQIKVAGVGINLHTASHVIFCELMWTPEDLTQAEDRVNRIGAVQSTHIIHFVMGGIDEMIARKIVEKQTMLEEVGLI